MATSREDLTEQFHAAREWEETHGGDPAQIHDLAEATRQARDSVGQENMPALLENVNSMRAQGDLRSCVEVYADAAALLDGSYRWSDREIALALEAGNDAQRIAAFEQIRPGVPRAFSARGADAYANGGTAERRKFMSELLAFQGADEEEAENASAVALMQKMRQPHEIPRDAYSEPEQS